MRSEAAWPEIDEATALNGVAFVAYGTPFETFPPAATNFPRTELARPALPASRRQTGAIASIPSCRNNATTASPSRRSSGTNRKTLSDASASECAVLPWLMTRTPRLVAARRTAATSLLFCGPTTMRTPLFASSRSWCSASAGSPLASRMWRRTRTGAPRRARAAFASAVASSRVTRLARPSEVQPPARSRIAPTTNSFCG